MDASFVLAAILLTSPPMPPPDGEQEAVMNAAGEWQAVTKPATVKDKAFAALVTVLRPSLVALAVSDEILDLREVATTLDRDPLGDLAMLQGRSAELRTAPALGELARWPDRKTLGDMLQANRSLRTYFEARRALDLIHADDLRAGVENLDCVYAVIDSLRDAQADCYYVSVRKLALASFRDRIGEPAWSAGILPDPLAGCMPHDPAPRSDVRVPRRMPER